MLGFFPKSLTLVTFKDHAVGWVLDVVQEPVTVSVQELLHGAKEEPRMVHEPVMVHDLVQES
jgi:hypothetical protein